MMKRRFDARQFVATLAIVVFLLRLSSVLGQVAKPAQRKITITKKWEFSFPDIWKTPQSGVVSPDEKAYFRNGVLLDLETGKTIEIRKDRPKAGFSRFFFTAENRAIVAEQSNHGSETFSLWDVKQKDWLVPPWRVGESIRGVFPASKDRVLIWVRSDRGELLVFNYRKRQIVGRIPCSTDSDAETRPVVSADGEFVALVFRHPGIGQIWRLSDAKMIFESKMPWAGLTKRELIDMSPYVDVSLSPNLKRLAFRRREAGFADIGEPKDIFVIDFTTGKRLCKLRGDSGVGALVFCNDNKWLLSRTGAIKLWEIDSGKNLTGAAYKDEFPGRRNPRGIPEHPKVNHEAIGLVGLLVAKLPTKYEFDIRRAAISPDAKYIAMIDNGRFFQNKIEPQVYLFSLPGFDLLPNVSLGEHPGQFLQFSSKGKYLLAEGKGKTFVWKLRP